MGSANMEMAFKIRSSKFRHVYGKPFRKEMCLENLRITRNAHDSNFCCVNPKNLAVVIESAGGGSFLVLPTTQGGRVDINAPRVCGHAGAVLDIKWNPFDDDIIASSSDDATVKIWQIPPQGLDSDLTDWMLDLHGHQRRIGYIEWHPTAANILLSAGFDYKCIIWNVEQAEPVNIVECHNDTIFSINWNRDGSLFATTSKDKKLRVIDPRIGNVASECNIHLGTKASKAVFLGDSQRIFTTGFSRMSYRQYAVWDIRNMNSPMKEEEIDCSSGVIIPHYDHDTGVVFLAGKGDGNIRFFEVVHDAPYIHFLNEYQSPSPQRGLAVMPKRGCDVSKCEIVRFYKLHAAKNFLEPISMIVPRKSEKFQADVFPPTPGAIPSLSADEWISGQNREPILISLEDGQVTNSPKITTSKAVQSQDGALQQAPVITTYKAVTRPGQGDWHLRRAKTVDSSTLNNNREEVREPASVKNIKRLSMNEDFLSISENNELNQRYPSNDSDSTASSSPEKKAHYEKRVWSPVSPQSPVMPPFKASVNGVPESDSELKKAYFRQQEEIRSLKEQVGLKDKRIRQLEEELQAVRDGSCGPGVSNC